MQTLKTERLIIRPFTEEDGADLYEYLSDEEVIKFEPYDAFSLEESKKEAARRASDEAFWAVCLKENNKLIGNIYFQKDGPEEFRTWEIGYVFNSAYYGNGYATEACKCLMKLAFEEYGAHRIIALCNPDNTPSWKLLERLKMRREGHFLKPVYFKYSEDNKPLWHNAYQYAILEEEWSKNK